MWQTSTNDKAYDHGPILAKSFKLRPEQEECVLLVRAKLMETSFGGLPAFPHMWHSPRHPAIVEAVQREQAQHKGVSFLSESTVPAGHRQAYGAEHIRREVNRLHPQWSVATWQVVQCLKDSGYIHSDDIAAQQRPHFRAFDDPVKTMTVRKELPPAKIWQSKTLFVEMVNAIATGKEKRRLEGLSQWLLLEIPVVQHSKNMETVRDALSQQ